MLVLSCQVWGKQSEQLRWIRPELGSQAACWLVPVAGFEVDSLAAALGSLAILHITHSLYPAMSLFNMPQTASARASVEAAKVESLQSRKMTICGAWPNESSRAVERNRRRQRRLLLRADAVARFQSTR